MGVSEDRAPRLHATQSARGEEFDAVIVGASLAGCTAALKLGRAGARVALVEQRPDPHAFKQVCSHFVQASAVPTLERLGLLDAVTAAGAVRSSFRIWTRWGWIVAPPESAQYGLNLRRELLDPLLRAAALGTPGVESFLGYGAVGLVRDGHGSAAAGAARGDGPGAAADGAARGAAAGRVRGVVVRDRAGEERQLRARLVVGADGRGSRIARLSGVATKTTPHGRFAYGAYFEGPQPAHAPDASLWMLDPQWAAAFPTDAGLTFYAAMPTKDRLPEFRGDPAKALVAMLADLPEPPPIRQAKMVGTITGKLDMPNVEHEPTAPGLALIGDAALATDPLWGIGCGWALQTAEWLGDAVAGSLAADGAALDTALASYRRRWRRGLRPHARVIDDFAGGRRLNAGERLVFAAAARDGRVAAVTDAFGARVIDPNAFLVRAVPRAVAVNVRHALERRPRYAPLAPAGVARLRSEGDIGARDDAAASATTAAVA
ncbi:NAD(P)/FAD-dependent oxidoreductase [Conexibacter sp. CPCC 206217]|uniref:NAD(P)/FAD-dependent oxidoreductase n=1 Tax=Conexibacter sp. CPCC 206217 TaxID=3064574 RepID=UPI00271ADE95|nr:FAD-dependent monooxygenase [Conexibacter sp. CPCC 206217]MDO8211964.1 FAD-dependent monooxygenase [Conexibacter sp. CPCC 206217]